MKKFLLTLEVPGFKGWESIEFRRVDARTAQSAVNKMRKYIEREYRGSYYRYDMRVIACEEITSTRELHERKRNVESEIAATLERLNALKVEQCALRRICGALE